MIILGMRTDKPEAELYICTVKGPTFHKLSEIRWQANLKLAETLNSKIQEILNMLSISYKDLEGVAVYKGPGSFTGLRIGMSVANALAYSQGIPVAAKGGDDWLGQAVQALRKGQNDKIALPEYGAPARVTKPKK